MHAYFLEKNKTIITSWILWIFFYIIAHFRHILKIITNTIEGVILQLDHNKQPCQSSNHLKHLCLCSPFYQSPLFGFAMKTQFGTLWSLLGLPRLVKSTISSASRNRLRCLSSKCCCKKQGKRRRIRKIKYNKTELKLHSPEMRNESLQISTPCIFPTLKCIPLFPIDLSKTSLNTTCKPIFKYRRQKIYLTAHIYD